MNFKLSEYQQNILDYVKFNKGNLLIDAKAGSGKTSTLVLIASELMKNNEKCMFLSFNKSIVDELKCKIPELGDRIKTVHSLGLSFIRSYCYKKHQTNYELVDMEISKRKVRELCKLYYEKFIEKYVLEYNANQMSETELKEVHSNIITDYVQLVNFARLYFLNDFSDEKQLSKLVYRYCKTLPDYEDIIPNYLELVPAVINKIFEMFENPDVGVNGKYQYSIDFVDMIYFPVWYKMNVPYSLKDSLDTILVDESQDLSVLQQLFVKRLYTGFNRFIFVGDKFQSIYAFNGADSSAIDNIIYNFNPKQLPLSICYRCPEKIVRLSQTIVPSIQWNKNREDKGLLDTTTYTGMKNNLQPGDVIIGRRNKDLLKIYKDLTLNEKIEVKFKNTDLVNSIIRDITQCIKDYMQRYAKNQNIDRVVYAYMNEFCQNNNIAKKSKLYNIEVDNFIKKYIDEHKTEFEKKSIMKSHHTLEYLEKCMEEYKVDGAYNYESDSPLTEYYDIILEFIDEYKQISSSILVKDFIEYMEKFLKASFDKYNAPIISSVHSMKGGEADTIYIYDYPRFPYKWADMTESDMQQELNLQYVAITRAKKNLHLILCDPNSARDEKQFKMIVDNNNDCKQQIADIVNTVDNLNASKYNL